MENRGCIEVCYQHIADYWSIYLDKKFGGNWVNIELKHMDIANLMTLLKIASQECYTPDYYQHIADYWSIYLDDKFGDEEITIELESEDIVNLMALLKFVDLKPIEDFLCEEFDKSKGEQDVKIVNEEDQKSTRISVLCGPYLDF